MNIQIMGFISPEEQSKQLREYINSLGAKDLSEEAKPDSREDLNEIIPHIGVLCKLNNEHDLEMVLNSLIVLIVDVPRNVCDDVVQSICNKLQEDEFEGHEWTLIHVLSNLFYGFNGSGQQQCKIYCAMLAIAARSGLVKCVITDLNRVKEWLSSWKLSVEEQRTCLRQLHAALSQGQDANELGKVMYELLSTYVTDADALKATNDAKECVRSALADPHIYIFDHLLTLKPVQSLSNSKDLIYQLLQIFVGGSLSDYEKFYSANKSYVDNQLKLSNECLTQKIRVLTLISMCENKTELPLNEVAHELNLPPGDELGEFIIKAVQSKAIQAKIDQVHNRLIVGFVKNRRFSMQHWKNLRVKLDNWSVSLKQVKKYMESVA